jgi:plastocyanin
MAKSKKAAKKKVSAAPRRSVTKHHHHWPHHDFMLVLAGGFVVIVMVLFLSGTFRETVSTYTNSEASTDGMVKMDDHEEAGVTIQSFSYSPETITVKKGTTVTWTNTDTDDHSATADDGSFDTGLLSTGGTGSVTFTEVGSHTYHCSTHPNMTGTVVVVE